MKEKTWIERRKEIKYYKWGNTATALMKWDTWLNEIPRRCRKEVEPNVSHYWKRNAAFSFITMRPLRWCRRQTQKRRVGQQNSGSRLQVLLQYSPTITSSHQHHPIYNISNLVPLFLVWLTLKLKLNFLFCISSNCCNTPTASQLLCLMQCYFQFECSLIHEQSTEGLLWMTKRTPPKTSLKIIGLQW